MKKDKAVRHLRLFRINVAYAEKRSYMGAMGPGEGMAKLWKSKEFC